MSFRSPGSPASGLCSLGWSVAEGSASSPTPTTPVQNPFTDRTLAYNFFHWVLGFTLIYAMLFGLGDLLFSRLVHGCALIALSAACLAVLFWSLNRRGWSVWK